MDGKKKYSIKTDYKFLSRPKKTFFTTGEKSYITTFNISNRHMRRMARRQHEENDAIKNGTKSKAIISVEI